MSSKKPITPRYVKFLIMLFFTLWPNGIHHPDVLLFLSDAAPYMVKAVNCLQDFYPKMVHITCVVYGLHWLTKKIRGQFSKINEPISNTKKKNSESSMSYRFI